MMLTWPLALLGLLGIPLLVLLERWRRRPGARVWPSLQLWRAVKNLDAPSERRIEPLLIYECGAILLLTLAAAGPVVSGSEEPEIIVLVDIGRHMQARLQDGRTALDATLAEVKRIPGEIRRIDVDGDLVAAATSLAGPVVLATNRPDVDGPGYVVVGRAADGHNVGIDAVEVRGDRLWFALATDGEPREVDVTVGDKRMRVRTGVGVETDFAESIRIDTGGGNYPDDDAVALRRVLVVVKTDSDSPYLKSALRAGVPVRTGFPSRMIPDLIIDTKGGTPIPGVVRGADCVANPGIFDGLLLDACVWHGVRTLRSDEVFRRFGPLAIYPRPLLTHAGQALAYLYGRTLWLGLPLDRDWDEHGTLAVLIDRAKRARVAKGAYEVIVGDAIASPAPGFVDTRGVDRPWKGRLPKGRKTTTDESSLARYLGLFAVAVLALYARAMLRA